MNKYLFKTSATLKDYNKNNYWLDRDYIKDTYISANDLEEAINKYTNYVNDNYLANISKNAVKNKQPIYRDRLDKSAIQIGYCFTACIDIDKGDYKGYTKQYIELWVEIMKLSYPKFKESAV